MLPPVPQLHQPIAPQTPPTAHRASHSQSALSHARIVSSKDHLSSTTPRFLAMFIASFSAGANTQTQRCSLDCVRISFFVSGLALRAFSFLPPEGSARLALRAFMFDWIG